ncbi:MAG: hypothetical protein IPI61_08905 [Syntrophaceae bacterium]|jgi:hypothetical protein|nr:hypothetical protein [Syntrophaceae bacterium]HPG70425.1 hypothetical protein [Syntrophales bacterium]HPV54572.1 hypothetical protein [Syntrophales bacterium]
MNLKQWADNGWLKSHKTSREEIANLLAIVERDLADAANESISPDSRFGIAYNAALKLCTVLLSAAGYRADKTRHHYLTITGHASYSGARQGERCTIPGHLQEQEKHRRVSLCGKRHSARCGGTDGFRKGAERNGSRLVEGNAARFALIKQQRE